MKYQMSLPKVGLRSKVKAVVCFQRTLGLGASMYEIIAPHAAAALGTQFLDNLFRHGKGINRGHMVSLPPKVGRFHHKVQCPCVGFYRFYDLELGMGRHPEQNVSLWQWCC